MKARRIFSLKTILFNLFLVVAFAIPVAADQNYRIDPVHSFIVFKIKHLGITYVYGRFNGPRGTVMWNKNNPSKSSVEMYVKTKGVDTNNDQRDNHLRSPDFFDAKEHPAIKFKSKTFKKVGSNTYEVSGDLTLHGVTKPLTTTVKETGHGRDPWGGIRKGFETSFTIKRTDFGMVNLLDAAGDEVVITVTVEGILL